MLRRVIVHLRRQDWTAVFIELAVVVVGVFIGVQVSNWNGQRETDQKAAVFTERPKSDLREEAWRYEVQVGYWSGAGSAEEDGIAIQGGGRHAWLNSSYA